ncbi:MULTISPECIES: hypothetical protein [Microbacterium]|uniref:Uncharacterized protein n=1 Tax=Microbacterium maritypicum MF109 TaxID=1333857 RepID=T5KIU5_MICMQ|nr:MULTISPECIES: hypothetical protein [Microbacterium]EQM75927.1 hypothetical protein L687_18630 [Microbacterium maritypicum MF109]
MISLDSTPVSTVVLCSRCPGYADLADSRTEGWRIGARHEERAHPDIDQARDTLSKIRARA